MDTRWLEDFISLAETRSFSKSATQRHVSQPAFSRRIRSLETWLGTDLIDRTSYPTKLTPAGEVFYEQALEMLAQINTARELMRDRRGAEPSVVTFAMPHTLTLTYFPEWLTQIRQQVEPFSARALALNVHDAIMQLAEGNADLTLCYYHPQHPLPLTAETVEYKVLGEEPFFMVSRARNGEPEHSLPGKKQAPLPFLSYSPNAYLSRMADLMIATSPKSIYLNPIYETDMSESLKSMMLAGHGVAFLPQSAVAREMASGRAVDISSRLDPEWELRMQVRLYRRRSATDVKPAVAAIWDAASKFSA
jgi:DNA-binding transcriptional LysR family regulator